MLLKRILSLSMAVAIAATMFSTNTFAASVDTPEGKHNVKNKLYLRKGVIDVSYNSDRKVSKDHKKKGKKMPYIVSFEGPELKGVEEALRNSGAKVIEYLPDFSFLILMKPEKLDSVWRIEEVVDIIPYLSDFKIGASISKDKSKKEDISVDVITFEEDTSELENTLVELKAKVQTKGKNKIKVEMKREDIGRLSQLDSVKYIGKAPEDKLYNDIARGLIGNVNEIITSGYDGRGQIVAVADTGLDTGVNDNTMHMDFQGRIVDIQMQNGTKKTDYIGKTAADTNGHGTHVAGSVLGNGSRSYGQLKGVAPGAGLVFQSVYDSVYNRFGDIVSDDLYLLLQRAYDKGARIHSNSWGSNDGTSSYTKRCASLDSFVWDHPDMVVLAAAGNDGEQGIGDPATSKNCITVGASENNRPYWTIWGDDVHTVASFSSQGYCSDGRIKPDVVAPGTFIASTRSSLIQPSYLYPNNSYYMYKSGTSMAAPITAGTVAVIRQYLQQVKGITNPSAALIKAVLINGAEDLGYGFPGVNHAVGERNKQGWGRINLNNSLYAGKSLVDETVGIGGGQQKSYTCTVSDSAKPLKISLVWTDYPASLELTKSLIHDLDIKVISPSGKVYYGNNFNNTSESTLDSTIDRRNNVENVYITKPEVGDYKIEVSVFAIQGELKQPFALVASHDFFGIPSNITSDTTLNSINIKWDKVPGATSYDIEIDNANTINLTSTQYLHTNLPIDEQHSYRVRARNASQMGKWSARLTTYTKMPSVQNVQLETNKKVDQNGNSYPNNYIKIGWNSVPLATNYLVEQNGSSAYIAANPTLLIDNQPNSYEYDFRVMARKDFNYSDWSLASKAKTYDVGISVDQGMSQLRSKLGVAAINEDVYTWGGFDGNAYVKTFKVRKVYAEEGNKQVYWEDRPQPTYVRGSLGIGVIGNKIYGIGGITGVQTVNGSQVYSTTNKVEVFDTTNNSWTEITAGMPTARGEHAVAVVNNLIYAIGGTTNGSNVLSTVEVFNPATNSWLTKASMPTARKGLSVAVVNNKIYVIGGSNGTKDLNILEVYDPVTNTWTTKAGALYARYGSGAVTALGKVYVAGGKSTNTIEEYNPQTNIWTTVAEISDAYLYDCAMAANSEGLFIFGGINENGIKKSVIKYAPWSDGWKRAASMPFERILLDAAVINNKIYAVGGSQIASSYGPKDEYSKLLEEYDPVMKCWTKKADLPKGRFWHNVIAFNGLLYVFGGQAETTQQEATVDVYNPSTDQWQTRSSPMNYYLRGSYATVFNGKFYVMGGALSTAIIEYDPQSDAWTKLGDIPDKKTIWGLTEYDNKLYAFLMQENAVDKTKMDYYLEEYKPETNSWIRKAVLPIGLERIGKCNDVEKIGDRIFIISQQGLGYDSIEYNMVTNSIGLLSKATIDRADYCSVALNDKIYLIGGATKTGDNTFTGATNIVEEYTPTKTEVIYPPSSLNVVGENEDIKVIWNAVPSITGYEIEVDGSVTSNGTSTTFVHNNNLPLRKNHHYRVRAKKASILSNWSKMTSVAYIVYADVNGDGNVTQDDKNLMSQHISGSTQLNSRQLVASDLNCDGLITTADINYFDRYLPGQTQTLPTGSRAKVILYGDVNQDNIINQADALMVQDAFVSIITLNFSQSVAADVNGDNLITMADSGKISSYYLDAVDRFPLP